MSSDIFAFDLTKTRGGAVSQDVLTDKSLRFKRKYIGRCTALEFTEVVPETRNACDFSFLRRFLRYPCQLLGGWPAIWICLPSYRSGREAKRRSAPRCRQPIFNHCLQKGRRPSWPVTWIQRKQISARSPPEIQSRPLRMQTLV